MSRPNHDGQSEAGATAPESLDFLVGSWNRFEVLNALDSTSRTRHDLRDLTGVSRPTLSRILSDLVDRGWVQRHNDEYVATEIGGVVASELEATVANIETAQTLGTALGWLPTDRFGFALDRLADADVLTPSPQDHTGPMRQIATYLDGTTAMRSVATGVTFEVVRAICEACLAGDLSFRCVLGDDAVAGVRENAELAEMIAEMIDGGSCEAFHYVGDEQLFDFNVLDETTMFCGISGRNYPQGVLISTDDAVRSWAAYRYEAFEDQSHRLDPGAFSG